MRLKKSILAFLLMLIAVAFSPVGYANEAKPPPQDTSFVFPASLEEVEEEALEGTAVTTVVFQSNVVSIGDRAFADTAYLHDIFIPPTTEYIGENAFPDNTELIIHGVKGSYAEKWANEHQVPFVVSNIWCQHTANGRLLYTQGIPLERMIKALTPDRLIGVSPPTAYGERSMRPQDRPELNPIDYRFP